jgi:hypothetical protein
MGTRVLIATFSDGKCEHLHTEARYTHAYRVVSSYGSSAGWTRSAAAAHDAGSLNLALARRNGDRDAELEIVEAIEHFERCAA